MTVVDRAEKAARVRAVLFYLMAATLLLSAWLGLGEFVDDKGRIVAWAVMVVVTALNLTPVAGWLRPGPLARLLDDEQTRDHRGRALQAGFWAAMASAMLIALIWPYSFLGGLNAARIVVTASLTAALVSFATLELRAARG